MLFKNCNFNLEMSCYMGENLFSFTSLNRISNAVSTIILFALFLVVDRCTSTLSFFLDIAYWLSSVGSSSIINTAKKNSKLQKHSEKIE